MTLFDLLCNIEHTLSGRDHIIDDNNILALNGIAKELMSNDRVLAVYNSGVIAAFVEHTHIDAEDI